MMKNRGIVIVNQSAGYLMTDIAKAYIKSGKYDDVVLMVGNPDDMSEAEKAGIRIDAICPYSRVSLKTRMISWVKGAWQIVRLVNRKYKGYELLLVSNPPTIHFLAYFCKNRYSALVYDIYPDGLITGGYVTKNNVIYKIWHRFACKFYEKARRVVVISNGMAEKLTDYCDKSKIEVIPLWYNRKLHQVVRDDNVFIKNHHLENYFIVLYSGNVGKGSNIKLIVDLAERLQDVELLKFVIVGEGMEKQTLINRTKKLGLNNIMFLPYQPVDMMSHSLSSAHLAYVSVDNAAAMVCVPSKTFNLINVETPLLCVGNRDSELARMINAYHIGQCFDPHDLDGMETFVRQTVIDSTLLEEYKENIRKAKIDFSPSNALNFV